ncbi:MFS transporter [Telmatocola sphagniphila]|uniref:MFS transporter n=1 Tax=Telmatocola sphagniphila TaxID=1123043 RepID=A0A8E6B9S7_9BACT|nr:MFS transporter [Telmatocola sphagniphila]
MPIGIGITNLVFTFIGLRLIDKLGRRTLLYIGSFGYIASLGVCSLAFFSKDYGWNLLPRISESTSFEAVLIPISIFAFIAAHAVGQGAVIWVFISEIFPNRFRSQGQSLGSFTHWIFAAILANSFPSMARNLLPGYIFLFFCGMMCLQLIWVYFFVPETKGRSLEQISEELEK